MKINVTITVDIPDPKQWTTAFGVKGAREIRADVKTYVGEGLNGYGVFGNGEVNATIEYR